MYWMLFTVARKVVGAVASKAFTKGDANSAPDQCSAMTLLQLILSFASFILTFIALLLIHPPCSTTLLRVNILLSLSSYAFFFATLMALILLAINPPLSWSISSRPASSGKWRNVLLKVGTVICWIEILLGFVALAVILAIQHTGSAAFKIIALINIGALTLCLLIFAILPETIPPSPLSRPTSEQRDLQTERTIALEAVSRESREEMKRQKQLTREREREQDRMWEDPRASPTVPTRPFRSDTDTQHMPLTPAPGDEKAAFAKAQAKEAKMAHQRADIVGWKKWMLVGVFVIQSVCLLILVVLGIKDVSGMDLREYGAGRCEVQRVEIVKCAADCGGRAGTGSATGEEEMETMTVTEKSTETSTLVETEMRTVTASPVQIPGTSAGVGGGGGGVKTVIVVTSTTTTVAI